MAFDRQQLKITASGFLGADDSAGEIWTWGLHVTGLADYDAEAALAEVDMEVVSNLVAAFHGDGSLVLSQYAKYTTLKIAALDVAGHYLTDVRSFEVTAVPGAGLNRPPNQVALCVSLRTGTNIGVATRGRFYLPLPATAVGPNGRLTSTYTTQAATAAQVLINGLNDHFTSLDEQGDVALMSITGVTSPRSRAVTEVRVGDVLDTIQDRRRQLEESYSIVAITP